MATIILKTDGRSSKAKLLLSLIEEFAKIDKSIEIITDPEPGKLTLKAAEAARKGDTVKCSSFNDYLAKVK